MLKSLICGSNSVGRVRPCQGRCRGFESRLPLQNIKQFARENPIYRRGSQVVRQRSAKPLFVGSIPTRASIPNALEVHISHCKSICYELCFALRHEAALVDSGMNRSSSEQFGADEWSHYGPKESSVSTVIHNRPKPSSDFRCHADCASAYATGPRTSSTTARLHMGSGSLSPRPLSI